MSTANAAPSDPKNAPIATNTLTTQSGKPTGKSRGFHHFIAGQVGGATGLAVAYPFDTIKVRLQTYPGTYSGPLNCFTTMVKTEGVLSLYRGLISPLVGYGAINSVAFGTYGTARLYFAERPSFFAPKFADGHHRKPKLWEMVLSGGVAGCASSLVRSPIERIKTLCQSIKNADGTAFYRGSLDCAVQTVKAQGLPGLMAGTWSTMLREVPQYALYYPFYEWVKRALTPKGVADGQIPGWRLALAGGLAGVVQWMPPMYSIDVIKSRIQAVPAGHYKGVLDCAKLAYREEGAGVFIRGISPALLRAFPLHATIFLVYELVIRVLAH